MQARITPSALQKVAEAHSDDLVKFVLWLSEPMLTEPEIEAIRSMGCKWAYQSVRVATVEVPARCLMELAALPSVVRIS